MTIDDGWSKGEANRTLPVSIDDKPTPGASVSFRQAEAAIDRRDDEIRRLRGALEDQASTYAEHHEVWRVRELEANRRCSNCADWRRVGTSRWGDCLQDGSGEGTGESDVCEYGWKASP